MGLEAARLLVALLAAWTAIGALFAIWFVVAGVARIDSTARGAGFGFRALIFPASVVLWPLLLARCLRGDGAPPRERNAHRDAAREPGP